MNDNANTLYAKQVEYLLSIYRKNKDNMICVHKHIHALKSEYNFKSKSYLTLIQHLISQESSIDTLYSKASNLMCKQHSIVNNHFSSTTLSIVNDLSFLTQHRSLFQTLFELLFIYDEHRTMNEHVQIYFANVNEMKRLFDIVSAKYKTATTNVRHNDVLNSDNCQYKHIFPFDVFFEFIRNAKMIGDLHTKISAETERLRGLESEKNSLFIQLKRIEHQIGLYKQLYKEKKKHLDSLKHIHNTYSHLAESNAQLNTVEQVNHLIIQLTLTEQNIELLKAQLSTTEDIKSEYSLNSDIHSLKSIMNCYQSKTAAIEESNSEDNVNENGIISLYKYIDVVRKEKVDEEEEEGHFEFEGSICDEKYDKDGDALNNGYLCKSSIKFRSIGGTVLEQGQQFNTTRPRTIYKTDCIRNSTFPIVPQTSAPNEAHGCCNDISYCSNNCI